MLTLPERVARRLLMDFGFGSLVDKFEVHIGTRATGALLSLAAVAAFVLCVRTIIVEGIAPLVQLVRGVSSESAQSVMGGILIGFAIAVASGMVFAGIARWLVKRAVAPVVQRAQAHVDRAERVTEEAEACAAEVMERLDQLTSEAEARIADGASRVAQMKANSDPTSQA